MSAMFSRNLKYIRPVKHYIMRSYATSSRLNETPSCSNSFEMVFSFPTIKYIALINRLKVYHLIGTSMAIPSCGLLEMLNTIPEYTFVAVSYIGITGAAVLALASLPLSNVIGNLYISKDNKEVKISYVDFWGRRRDRIEPVENWIPLLAMSPRLLDAIYLSPQLSDGTKYKLFLHFGKVKNATKLGQVLE